MNIKIIIYLLIICLIPAASASKIDNVWAARSSGFIGSNDTLRFENYLIKANTIDDKKASIAVYKNENKIEQRIFNVRDFQEYDTIRVTLLGIKKGYSWIAISKPDNIEIWRSLGSKSLKWGERYTIENYTISAQTFSQASVNLTISSKDMTEIRIFSNNSFSDLGNLRIIVTNVDPNGSIDLLFLTNTTPEIRADISTDKDEYTPDEIALVTINISGETVQNIIGIYLESGASTEIRPDMISSTGVRGKRSFQFQIMQLPANSTINVTASIKIHDYYGNEYTTKISKIIHTTPVISITKRAPADTDEKNVSVELYIYNAGSTEESISVYDTVYEKSNFKQLNWSTRLKPKNSTNISYYISPQKLGPHILAPAIAKWKNQSSASKEIVMAVHGPFIIITKSAEKRNNLTIVKLAIYNSGDRSALVNVSDRIPDGHSIINGNTTWSGLLGGGESTAITYSLPDSVKILPAASTTYSDIHGVFQQMQSNIVELISLNYTAENNSSSSLDIKPDEILLFMVSSFIAIAGVITGMVMVAYLSVKLKKN